MEKLGTIWKQNIYIADFLPTLADAAGIYLDIEGLQLDGLNLWSALKYGYERVEREILHNIDDVFGYVAYSKGKWKLVNGTTDDGLYDGYFGGRAPSADDEDPRSSDYAQLIRNTTVWRELQRHNFHLNKGQQDILTLRAAATVQCQLDPRKPTSLDMSTTSSENLTIGGIPMPNIAMECRPLEGPCLFDLDNDPCESRNLYNYGQNKYAKIIGQMWDRIDYFRQHAHPLNNQPSDPRSDPIHFNNEWTWWQDALEGNRVSNQSSRSQGSFSFSCICWLMVILCLPFMT